MCSIGEKVGPMLARCQAAFMEGTGDVSSIALHAICSLGMDLLSAIHTGDVDQPMRHLSLTPGWQPLSLPGPPPLLSALTSGSTSSARFSSSSSSLPVAASVLAPSTRTPPPYLMSFPASPSPSSSVTGSGDVVTLPPPMASSSCTGAVSDVTDPTSTSVTGSANPKVPLL